VNKKLLLTITLIFVTLTATAGGSRVLVPPATTQLQGCGQTLAALNSSIVANLVAGASSYRFRVSTVSPQGVPSVQIHTSNTRTFKLTQLASFAFDRAYTIDVAIRHGNQWYPYGPACTIYSPTPTTTLESAYCGAAITSMSSPIYAQGVNYAQGYRFRVTNLLNQSEVYIVDRPLREFRLNNFNATSGSHYLVEVAIKNYGGSYLPYGPPCSVTAPVLYTQVATSFCGHTLGAMSDQILANLVSTAQGYRFKITSLVNGSTQTIDRPLRVFSMNMLSNILYNHPYKIEVALKNASGTYLPYGQPCTVYTPGLPIPKIQLSQCELVGPPVTEAIYADEYPSATVYRFKLENLEQGYSHTLDRGARYYTLNMFSGLLPNTAYTVRVAVKVNGTFTPYGKACDVTTPGNTSRFDNTQSRITDASEMPKVYPNPYSEYFSMGALPSDAEVSVGIYDMTGRLLESHKTTGNALPSLQLGKGFPTGVYNLIINESDTIRTHRVVKR
jgi:hypothetical protein